MLTPVVPDLAPEAVEPVLVESIGVQTEEVQPVAPEVLAVPEVRTGPSLEDLKQYNRTAKLRMWPLICPSPAAHAKYNEWAGVYGRPLMPALPSPSSSSFGIPAVAEGNQPKRNAKGQQNRMAKGQLKCKAKDQPKRKAKDNNGLEDGAIRKFLKPSE